MTWADWVTTVASVSPTLPSAALSTMPASGLPSTRLRRPKGSGYSVKPWINAAASVTNLALVYDDAGNVVAGSGTAATGKQYSFATETFSGKLPAADGVTRRHMVRHIRFYEGQDAVPLQMSTIIGLDRNTFRFIVSHGSLTLILDFDFGMAGAAAVTRTIQHDGTIFSSQNGAYIIESHALSLTNPAAGGALLAAQGSTYVF